MKDAYKFRDLVKFLAENHPDVMHSPEKQHFACSLDAAENAYARNMFYPCVALDLGDMRINSAPMVERSITLMFMHHVADTGSESEKENAFSLTCDIAIDFLAQLESIAEKHPEQNFLSRFSVDGADLIRVEFEEASLYGWMVRFEHTFSLNSIICEHHFGEDIDERVDAYFAV